MKRSLHCAASALVALAMAGLALAQVQRDEPADAAQEKRQHLTLEIEGVECARCASVMTQTLQSNGLEIKGQIKPQPAGRTRVVVSCPAEYDLGMAAARVNEAPTPHREKVAPALGLVLFAELNSESEQSVAEVCRKTAGLDVEHCRIESKEAPQPDEIQLRLTGKTKLTIEQLTKAFADANIQVRTQAQTAPRENAS